MKRILILILASGLIPALLLSCEKSVKFSCDPETDDWAVNTSLIMRHPSVANL